MQGMCRGMCTMYVQMYVRRRCLFIALQYGPFPPKHMGTGYPNLEIFSACIYARPLLTCTKRLQSMHCRNGFLSSRGFKSMHHVMHPASHAHTPAHTMHIHTYACTYPFLLEAQPHIPCTYKNCLRTYPHIPLGM